jgi:hypothetical protein
VTRRELRRGIDALHVEGPDDGATINALVRRELQVEIGQPLRLIKVGHDSANGGFEQASRGFRQAIELRQPGARLGLVADRDGLDGKPDRWLSIRGALRGLGLAVPDAPPMEGLILEGLAPGSRAGVWLMPDNLGPGDLEHLVERLVPAESTLHGFAKAASRDARQHGASYQDKDVRKAELHAWSAWLDGPGGGYGTLLERGDLSAAAPAARPLLAWFERLFLDP